MIRCPVCGGVCGPHICNRNVERDPPTDVRTGIVTWMRAVADAYAQQGDLIGDGYARNWRTIADLIEQEADTRPIPMGGQTP